ncbi:MAG: pseudouridine synthase [Phycisphaerales bacterium]
MSPGGPHDAIPPFPSPPSPGGPRRVSPPGAGSLGGAGGGGPRPPSRGPRPDSRPPRDGSRGPRDGSRGSQGGGPRGPRRDFGPPQHKGRQDQPPPRDLDIIHEDEHLLVVDKPPGLLTSNMPGEKRPALFDMVKVYVRDQKRQRGTKVWIIHRLDKEASGLLVFAKSERAYRWLKEDFRSRRVHRLYVAVVQGEIGATDAGTGAAISAAAGAADAQPTDEPKSRFARQKPSGTIQSFIQDEEFGAAGSVEIGDFVKAERSAERLAERRGPEVGASEPKLAITHYRVLESGQGRCLLQLRLETGRKNQIRIHMKEFGHPIVGDPRYGATDDPMGRMALHAAELGFTHPATGQSLRLSSQAPAAFYRSVGATPPKRPTASILPAAPVESQKSKRVGEAAGTTSAAVLAPLAESALAGTTASGSDSASSEASPPGASAPSPAREAKSKSPAVGPAAETSWDHVATWYDTLLQDERSDHFGNVILPGTLRLLRPQAGMRVLDVACGQGMAARKLAALGVSVTGVDAAARLIDAARQRSPECRFEVGDARNLASLNLGTFDAAICVMALMNIDTLDPVFRGVAGSLAPGGAFVAIILHPAFRAPGQTSWDWDEPSAPRGRTGAPMGRAPKPRQFRRVDGYLSPGQNAIVMNPARAAHGQPPVTTLTFHRPIQAYIKSLADAGFVIEALEEWPSMRRSQPGPRAAEEDRARREIPMFLGIRAIKR